jgi:hypothetical protein
VAGRRAGAPPARGPRKPDASPWAPAAWACAIGGALWFAASWLTGRREPWDAPAYWAVAYPLAIGAAAVLGRRYPKRPWRWALLLFESQFLAMCLRNGELGNLWPFGVAMFAVIAVPAIAAAQLAAGRGAARPPDRRGADPVAEP